MWLIIHMVVIDLIFIIMNAPSTIGSRQYILKNAHAQTYTLTPPISFLIMSADPEFFNDIINDYNDYNDETTIINRHHLIPPDSTDTINTSLIPKLMADPEFF